MKLRIPDDAITLFRLPASIDEILAAMRAAERRLGAEVVWSGFDGPGGTRWCVIEPAAKWRRR